MLSAADPRHTLLGLVGAPELPPEFVWHTQSIRMRGSVAKVHLLTDGNHGLPEGTLVVAPTLRYLEQAYDASKYGGISERPYLEVTTAGPVVSVHYQFASYALRKSDWQDARATLETRAIDALASYAPQLRDSSRGVQSITPLDLEQDWGLPEGDLNPGQLILDRSSSCGRCRDGRITARRWTGCTCAAAGCTVAAGSVVRAGGMRRGW